MKKISIRSIFRHLFAPRSAGTALADARCVPVDPFAHPALQAMDLRELADLPFEREARAGADSPEAS